MLSFFFLPLFIAYKIVLHNIGGDDYGTIKFLFHLFINIFDLVDFLKKNLDPQEVRKNVRPGALRVMTLAGPVHSDVPLASVELTGRCCFFGTKGGGWGGRAGGGRGGVTST